MKALISKERVIQIEEESFPVHKDLVWIECDDSVKVEYSYINGEFIAPVVKELTYIEKRKNAYPTIEDQLDMQYKDKVNNTTTWQDAIAKVKSDYPKV